MWKYRITVFTPTFNRAYIISALFESLKRQSFQDFEWLVIDDGSTDNTEELFQKFMSEKLNFKIRYLKKENGGQHRALNDAIPLAEGELFMIVDSDDFLSDNALERILYYADSIKGKNGFAGVSGLRCYMDGQTIGGVWANKEPFVDATNLERWKYHLSGDKAEAYYTDVLKTYYPLPVFDGENDVDKGILWNKIGHAGLKIRWFGENIYYCEYLNDGMSRNQYSNQLKNFQGYTATVAASYDYDEIPYLTKWKNLIRYFEVVHLKSLGVKDVKDKFSGRYYKLYLASAASIFTRYIHFKKKWK